MVGGQLIKKEKGWATSLIRACACASAADDGDLLEEDGGWTMTSSDRDAPACESGMDSLDAWSILEAV